MHSGRLPPVDDLRPPGSSIVRVWALSWATAFGRLSQKLGGLRGRLLHAAAWTSLAYLMGQVLRLGGNLIMTRLLAPEMFGVMSVVLAIQVTLTLLCDFGLRILVIQSKRGDEPEFLNTVWTLEVLRGAVIWLFGVMAAFGLLAASGFGMLPPGSSWAAPNLPAVIAVYLLTSVITGFQSTRLFTRQRHLDFRSVTIIEFASQVVCIVGMIGFGLLTRSIWALVVGSLLGAITTTLLSHLWLPGLRNRFAWDRATISEIIASGRWVMLSSLLFVVSANADRFLLAGYIGPAELGLYAIAIGMILLVESLGTRIMSSVSLASLSEKGRESTAALRASLSQQRWVFDSAYLLGSGLLFALGPWIIELLYDDRYIAAGPMLRVLALAMIFSRYNIFPVAYLALGKPHLMAIVSFVKLVSLVVLLPLLFYRSGLDGALMAVVVHVAVMALVILVINHRLQLNDLRLEMAVLPIWFVGWGSGEVFLRLIATVFG